MESSSDVSVATASKDRTVRLWKFDVGQSFDHPTKIRAYKILRGHNASIQSVAAQPSGDMVCSGSWDCRISMWQTNLLDKGGDLVSIKKRKMDSENEESQLEGEAVSTLVGHAQCVSSVVWPQNETIYSASWDHSIRRWDVETGKDSLNMVRMLVFFVLHCSWPHVGRNPFLAMKFDIKWNCLSSPLSSILPDLLKVLVFVEKEIEHSK